MSQPVLPPWIVVMQRIVGPLSYPPIDYGQRELTCRFLFPGSPLAITQPRYLARDGNAVDCELEVNPCLLATTATPPPAITQPLYLAHYMARYLARDGTAVACELDVDSSLLATTATPPLAITQPLFLARDGIVDACDLEVDPSEVATTVPLPLSELCKRLPLTVGHPHHQRQHAPFNSRRAGVQDEPVVITSSASSVSSCSGSSDSHPVSRKARKLIARQQDKRQCAIVAVHPIQHSDSFESMHGSNSSEPNSSESSAPRPRVNQRIIYDSDASESSAGELPAYVDPHEHGGPVDLLNLWKSVPHRFQTQYLDLHATHKSDIDEPGELCGI